MAKRNKRPINSGVRLSDKERIIVKYIVSQLETAYRNGAGKPTYARNMDQVMKDIFGIKKFTKTLERARYNESIMIGLMRKLDAETMWQICRSPEHYKLLCTLIALDAYIVDKGKKYDKLLQLEPTDRPTKKMRKIKSQAKKARKLYNSCIKTFRDVFDIKKPAGNGSDIFDTLEDWLNRYEGDDIFFGLDDYGFSSRDVESMDEYINSRRSGRRDSRGSALGLDLDDPDGFDDLMDEDDDDSIEDLLMKLNQKGVDIRPLVNAYQQGKARPPRRAQPEPDLVFDDFDSPGEDDGDDQSYMAQLIRTMADGFDSLRADIANMNGGAAPRPRAGRPASGFDGSPLAEMMAMSNPDDESGEDDAPMTDPTQGDVEDPSRPVPGGEVEPEA